MKNARLLLVCILFMLAVWGLHAARGALTFDELLKRQRAVATQKIAYGPLPDQFGELWLPEGKGPHPVVVMLHGGCWREDLPGVELMAYIAEDLRKAGVAVWNLEYRRLGVEGAGYPGTFLDVGSGVDALRQLAARNALDLSHVVILGHSAGGHLALWAAARSRISASSPLYQKRPLRLRAAVSLAGIGDLAAFREAGPACGGAVTIDAIAGASAAHGYADTSPAALLPLHVPQLIISGSRDDIVPAGFGDAYGALAKAAGDKVDILNISGAGHFDLIDPESRAWRQIRPALLQYLK